ncbi:thioredoxin family protein [Candidatus Pyrohabitans sp.]
MVETGVESWEKEVLGSPIPVLVDFYSNFCPPCFVMAEIIEKVAEKYLGRVKFVKVNVDENEELAERYEVLSVPTLAFFNEGELVDGVAGVMQEAPLQRKLESMLE